ncbi:hypothetical protein [Pedobacter sp.]|uniref:hypothetical protein n=1 Tax=Pedobacter sp. TaxID=1411316 RepID=UPI00396CEF16
MSDEEFEKTRVDILNLLANRELEKHDDNTIAHLNELISYFNGLVFAMNDQSIDKNDIQASRTIEYYQTIDIALQYYQIRDLYISIMP